MMRAPSRAIALASPADAARAASFGAEGAMLTRALRALREDKNATAALATLDEYVRDYPLGRLLHEAAVARLEALMFAGRREEALAALEGKLPALEPLGRSELVSCEASCARAGLGSLQRTTTSRPTHGGKDEIAARALLDLARMQQLLGDQAGAEENLRRYVSEFPSGSSVDEARRELGDP
jgi:TolA-binding protein